MFAFVAVSIRIFSQPKILRSIEFCGKSDLGRGTLWTELNKYVIVSNVAITFALPNGCVCEMEW